MFPTPVNRSWRGALLFILLLAAFQQLGSAAWIEAKAHFAQFLIADAWEEVTFEKEKGAPISYLHPAQAV